MICYFYNNIARTFEQFVEIRKMCIRSKILQPFFIYYHGMSKCWLHTNIKFQLRSVAGEGNSGDEEQYVKEEVIVPQGNRVVWARPVCKWQFMWKQLNKQELKYSRPFIFVPPPFLFCACLIFPHFSPPFVAPGFQQLLRFQNGFCDKQVDTRVVVWHLQRVSGRFLIGK